MKKLIVIACIFLLYGCGLDISLLPETPAPVVFRIAREKAPDNPHALFMLGSQYLDDNEYGKAIDAFRKATKAQPDFVEAYIGVGHSYRAQEHFARAEKAYQDALVLDQHNKQARCGLAWVRLSRGKFHAAREILTPLCELEQAGREVYRLIAFSYYLEGDYSQALEAMEHALQGSSPDEHATLIMIYNDLQSYIEKYGE